MVVIERRSPRAQSEPRTGTVSSLRRWLNSISLCPRSTIVSATVVGGYALKFWLTMSAFQVGVAVECVYNICDRAMSCLSSV